MVVEFGGEMFCWQKNRGLEFHENLFSRMNFRVVGELSFNYTSKLFKNLKKYLDLNSQILSIHLNIFRNRKKTLHILKKLKKFLLLKYRNASNKRPGAY